MQRVQPQLSCPALGLSHHSPRLPNRPSRDPRARTPCNAPLFHPERHVQAALGLDDAVQRAAAAGCRWTLGPPAGGPRGLGDSAGLHAREK